MGAIADWSVRVHVDNDESRAMDAHLMHAFTSDVRQMSHFFVDRTDLEGPSAIVMEVRASSSTEARVLVQHLLGEVRRRAGLPVTESRIVWVAPLAPGDESSHRFIAQAEDLLRAEQYDLAVVAAQIHVELHLSTLLRMLVDSDSSNVARGLLASRIEWTQTQPWQRDLFEHLIDRRLSKDFPDWKRYVDHVERRNAIVHRGQPVDRESAEESVSVAVAFWRWINDEALRSLAEGQRR